MPHIRAQHRFRHLVICLVGASLLIAAPAAAGSAWNLSGPLTAPTTPTLGDVTADTPTAVALDYDPMTQVLQLRLEFTSPPTRNAIRVEAGTARSDGTCPTDGLAVSIAAQDHMVTSTTTVTTQTWIPPRTEIGWSWSSRYPPGYGNWTYIGYDSWTMRHQWLKSIPGSWVQESHDVTSTVPDPSMHERVAGLGLATADGVLADTEVVANDSTAIVWSFASPLLESAPATCVAVHVANRRAPYLLGPAPAPVAGAGVPNVPTSSKTPTPVGTPRARARRVGRTLHLHLHGRAGALQVRIGAHSTQPLPYAASLDLRLGSKAPTSIAVRFRSGGTWSAWCTVPVASVQRRG